MQNIEEELVLLSVSGRCPLFMDGWPLLRDGSMEPSLPISHIVHYPYTAIRFHQAVLAFHHVAVSFLPRSLDVSCVRVVHAILIGVARVVFL
jgi:hypothetical protein